MSVRKEVQQVIHLNNQEKKKAVSKKEVRWEGILDKAKESHQSMTVKGNICWPPVCNINNSQTPPKGCRASQPCSVQKQQKPKRQTTPQQGWTTKETVPQEEVQQATKDILEK